MSYQLSIVPPDDRPEDVDSVRRRLGSKDIYSPVNADFAPMEVESTVFLERACEGLRNSGASLRRPPGQSVQSEEEGDFVFGGRSLPARRPSADPHASDNEKFSMRRPNPPANPPVVGGQQVQVDESEAFVCEKRRISFVSTKSLRPVLDDIERLSYMSGE